MPKPSRSSLRRLNILRPGGAVELATRAPGCQLLANDHGFHAHLTPKLNRVTAKLARRLKRTVSLMSGVHLATLSLGDPVLGTCRNHQQCGCQAI